MTRLAPARLALAFLLGGAAAAGAAETPAVHYQDGLLSIRCADAPLAGLLEQVKTATGLDLILEGTAGAARLTADIEAQPVSLALPRLLEGTGINYLLVADRADPRRVATLYVGDAKAGAAVTPAAAVNRRAARPPVVEPEALPIPDAPPEVEPPADDDEEVDSTPEQPAFTGPGAPPGAAGTNAVLDPFGRPIPIRGPGGRTGRAERRGAGRGNAAPEEQ